MLYYYFVDDPDMVIFEHDASDGVEIIPALAVISASKRKLTEAREKALENRREFYRKNNR